MDSDKITFSFIRLLSMLRETKDPNAKKEIATLRDAIYKVASKQKKFYGIKGSLSANNPDHAAVMNKAGHEYLLQQEQTPVVVALLNGSSLAGDREKMIENGDFSFTHDDSATDVFAKLGRVGYLSSWQQSNLLRYVMVGVALLKYRPPGLKTQTVIDVGCSEGHFLQFWYNNLQQPGKQKLLYTGIEVLEKPLEKAKTRWGNHDNLKFIQADMMKQRLKKLHPEKTDAVLLLEVIEHVGQKAARQMLKDSFDLLNDNGIICISSPNPQKHLGQQFVWVDNHLYEFSLDEMKAELEKVGFEIIDVAGWYADNSSLKRSMSAEQKKLYARFKLLGAQMATTLMAHLMPEAAKHYTIIARKPAKD